MKSLGLHKALSEYYKVRRRVAQQLCLLVSLLARKAAQPELH